MSKGMKSLVMTLLIILTVVFYFISQVPEQLTLENGFYEDENIMLQVYQIDRNIGIMKYNKAHIRSSIQSFPFSFSRYSMHGENSLQNFNTTGLKHGFFLQVDDERFLVNNYAGIPKVNRTDENRVMDKFFLRMEPYRNPEYAFQESGFFNNHFFAAQAYEQGDNLVLILSLERLVADTILHYGDVTIHGLNKYNGQSTIAVMPKTEDHIIVHLQIDEIKHQMILPLPEYLESIPDGADLDEYEEAFLNNINYY